MFEIILMVHGTMFNAFSHSYNHSAIIMNFCFAEYGMLQDWSMASITNHPILTDHQATIDATRQTDDEAKETQRYIHTCSLID